MAERSISADCTLLVLIPDDAGDFRPLGPSMAIKGADPAILRWRLRDHRLEDRKHDDGGDMIPNKPQIMPRRPLHTREAAKWLGISEKSLLEFARAGMIGKKRGGIWYFSMQSLCDFAGVPFDAVE